MDEATRTEIVERLKTLALSVVPDAACIEKYGGIVFERIPGVTETQFCGIFAYQKHVSLEFTNGAQLDDPGRILVGKGKKRRHIKITKQSDIVEKRCEEFLLQACDL